MSDTVVKTEGSGGSTAEPVKTDIPKRDENGEYTFKSQGSKKGTKVEAIELLRTHEMDPMRQLPGTSPYLDQEQRVFYEKQRAIVEDREPDLKNPPATQGTPYTTMGAVKATLPPQANITPDVVLPVRVSKD